MRVESGSIANHGEVDPSPALSRLDEQLGERHRAGADRVSYSVGVAGKGAGELGSLAEMVDQADQAMYAQKRAKS